MLRGEVEKMVEEEDRDDVASQLPNSSLANYKNSSKLGYRLSYTQKQRKDDGRIETSLILERETSDCGLLSRPHSTRSSP